MSASTQRLLTLFLSAVISGCTSYLGSYSSSQRMIYSTPAAVPALPGEGEALVYFIRPPNGDAWAELAVIYRNDDFVGFVPSNTMFPYYASSGEHLFMVYSDPQGAKPCARFLQAELLEGEIYAVQVLPSYFDLFHGGLELSPVHPRSFGFLTEWSEWMMNAQMLSNNTNAYRWAEQNREQVLETRERWLKKWTRKAVEDRPTLKSDYIIPYPHMED